MSRKRVSKYRSTAREYNGHSFASLRELGRYKQLLLLEKAGAISCLELQPRYEIIPRQRKADGTVEQAAVYTGDFRYIEGGKTVVEDVKSKATAKLADYVLRRKLMLQVHGVEVREVL